MWIRLWIGVKNFWNGCIKTLKILIVGSTSIWEIISPQFLNAELHEFREFLDLWSSKWNSLLPDSTYPRKSEEGKMLHEVQRYLQEDYLYDTCRSNAFERIFVWYTCLLNLQQTDFSHFKGSSDQRHYNFEIDVGKRLRLWGDSFAHIKCNASDPT